MHAISTICIVLSLCGCAGTENGEIAAPGVHAVWKSRTTDAATAKAAGEAKAAVIAAQNANITPVAPPVTPPVVVQPPRNLNQ